MAGAASRPLGGPPAQRGLTVGLSRWPLGDDFDADEVLGVCSPGVSTARTASIAAIATASSSRSGSRVVSFWSCRPGHMTARTQRLRRLRPANLMISKRDAGDQRDAEDARGDQPVPGGQADRGEDEDRDDHDDEQEARAAARVQAREALGVRGRQRQLGLVAGDRLVLGAVVLEHAAQVAQAREQHEVAEEDRGAQDALDQPEQERRVRAGP